MKRPIFLLTIAALVLAVLSSAVAEPVKLEYKFTKDHVDKFNVVENMSISVPGIPMPAGIGTNYSTTKFIQQRILEVLSDGSAKMRKFTSTPKFTGSVAPKGLGNADLSRTVTCTIAKDGKILNAEATAGINLSGMGLDQLSIGELPTLPPGPVDIGATWSQSFPVPALGTQINIDSKLVSVGNSNDANAMAEISQTYNAHFSISDILSRIAPNLPNGKSLPNLKGTADLSGTGRFIVIPAQGKLLRSTGSVIMTMKMEMPAEAVSKGAPPTINFTANMDFTQSAAQ